MHGLSVCVCDKLLARSVINVFTLDYLWDSVGATFPVNCRNDSPPSLPLRGVDRVN